MVGKAEWTNGEANPRFVVTTLKGIEQPARELYEDVYCARGDMENRIKESQADLFGDRISAATMRANQLRLWFSSMAYVLVCAVRRIGLVHTQFADATCGRIRLKLFKIGALVKVTARQSPGSAQQRLVEDHCSRVAARARDICQRRRSDTPFRGMDCCLRGIGTNDFPAWTDEAREQNGDVSCATSHVQTRILSLIPADTRKRRVIGSIRRA